MLALSSEGCLLASVEAGGGFGAALGARFVGGFFTSKPVAAALAGLHPALGTLALAAGTFEPVVLLRAVGLGWSIADLKAGFAAGIGCARWEFASWGLEGCCEAAPGAEASASSFALACG